MLYLVAFFLLFYLYLVLSFCIELNRKVFYGSTILELKKNDFISLSVRANADTDTDTDTVLTLAPDINAYVIIIKFV